MIDAKASLRRSETERDYHFRDWCTQIPELQLPEDCKIKIIPPFGGAIIRFVVTSGNASVSVYMDAYDELGCMDMKPYWEIYPGEDGTDPSRYWLNETDKLIYGIKKAIDRSKPKDEL